jgi:hypothetical protein
MARGEEGEGSSEMRKGIWMLLGKEMQPKEMRRDVGGYCVGVVVKKAGRS